MRLLLDTHILLWAAGEPRKLSSKARRLLSAAENTLVFSAASLWEIAIKRSIGRDDFRVDLPVFRRGLLENGYDELAIAGPHALAVEALPPVHKDPFDRMLIAQAQAEGIMLLTSDARVAQYPGAILQV